MTDITKMFWVSLIFFLQVVLISNVKAAEEPPSVSYAGVFLMGNKKAEAQFPLFKRNKDKLMDALRAETKKVHQRGTLPFSITFDGDIETSKHRIDNTLSLAYVLVRDDISTESFSASGTSINKTIINVGLVAILYDTRKIDGSDRNTIIFSFPLVGYAQRIDGENKCSEGEIDVLFVESAISTLREHLLKRLSSVTVADIFGEVTRQEGDGTVTVNIGSLNGLEDGQSVIFYQGGKKVASGAVVKLGKNNAQVEIPKGFTSSIGSLIKTTNMRSVSDETFQVMDVKVSSKKAAKYFPQEIIGPQVAQWFSNFLTERSGKVVQPSRVGGSWDDRATESVFSIIDRAGVEHQFDLPKPKYQIILDITGVSSKVTDSNDVNDICMFKAWMKLVIPSRKYEKEFDVVSSKRLIKGVQSFEEKNELFDLLYQLTAKMAKEAEL